MSRSSSQVLMLVFAAIATLPTELGAQDLAITNVRLYPTPDTGPIDPATIGRSRECASFRARASRRPRRRRRARLARRYVIFADDPAADVTAFARVALTIRGGRVVYDARR